MGQLFQFLFAFRAFILFIVLEICSVFIIITNNAYTGAVFFNSSNATVAQFMNWSQQMQTYWHLSDINASLAAENAKLPKQLTQYSFITKGDSSSTLYRNFDFIETRVVNNSIHQYKNFITLDKGTKQGIQPNMAVIGPFGIVGKIRYVSENFSVAMSILNIDHTISCAIKRTQNVGTVRWGGIDQQLVQFNFIPRHVLPLVGDTVVTSGYNTIFPPNIPVGIIRKVKLRGESSFYDIDVEISQDLSNISFVDIIKSSHVSEIDSLQNLIPNH